MSWRIGINGEEYHPWTVGYNPAGEGLALFIERGIPCEGHRQVFTDHTTNTPDPEDVEWVIREYKDEWENSVSSFVTFVGDHHKRQNFRSKFKDTQWDMYETYSAIFCTNLISEIAKRAEERFCDRM